MPDKQEQPETTTYAGGPFIREYLELINETTKKNLWKMELQKKKKKMSYCVTMHISNELLHRKLLDRQTDRWTESYYYGLRMGR